MKSRAPESTSQLIPIGLRMVDQNSGNFERFQKAIKDNAFYPHRNVWHAYDGLKIHLSKCETKNPKFVLLRLELVLLLN